MLIQEHVQPARDFLTAADIEFAAGDRLQGSEKMWGAASRALMAVAQRRGWQFGGHRQMQIAVNRLENEERLSGLRGGFQAAQLLHANFYHGFMEDFQIEESRALTRDFVGRILALMDTDTNTDG